MNQPIFIRCVFIRLNNNADIEGKIERKKVMEIIGELYHIPKEMRNSFIKELEEYKVITGTDGRFFVLNKNIKI